MLGSALFAALDDVTTSLEENSTKPKKYDENKTLDKEYKSVALQIQEFMKKQKQRYEDKTETIVTKEKNSTKILPKKVVKKDSKPKVSKKKKVIKKITHIKPKTINTSGLPKLAIIMDDIGVYDEVAKIKDLPFAITPSIFPPTKYYPKTPEIARNFKHYMVHFPMEAYKYKNIRELAIKTSDKIESIDKKIKDVKKYFPHSLAMNNHTGSKYTCDFDAMEEFFTVLNRYDIDFIDSRTASGTQCQKVGKLLDKKVLERDIFLDNHADISYIRNQLKKAVNIAKRKGYAIAICHPRDLTFEALQESEDILEGVRMVYIDELL